MSSHHSSVLLSLLLMLGACGGEEPAVGSFPLTRLRTDRTYLRDGHGRYVFFHGVNLSGSTKNPAAVSPQGVPTYVGKPFPLEKAREELAKIRSLGFNSLRLLVIWEGIEPLRRGEYDHEYLAYIREVVKLAGEQGLYVLLDMHQDMFSRHLSVKYNEHPPQYGGPGSFQSTLLALVQPYTDSVRGDGAPRWAVEACLPEKKMSSPSWGYPRILGGLDGDTLAAVASLYSKITGGDGTVGPDSEWLGYFLINLPGRFAVNETSDLLPFTFWGIAMTLSLDEARCYACLLAGDAAFPGLVKDGMSIKDYLQEAYANAWVKVVEQVKDLPNVIGYDIMNEPSGNFLVLTAAAGMIRAGAIEGARAALIGLLGEETGGEVYDVLVGLRLLPPDASPETLKLWGLDQLDLMGIAQLNNGFDQNHLRPFLGRVGRAILEVDPKAVIYFEGSKSLSWMLGSPAGGLGGQWEIPMTRPDGVEQIVFAPHWYPDIYPFPGFNQSPRSMAVEEVRHRDYQPKLEAAREPAAYSLGNPPVVFGEFGTYFNFNGIQRSIAEGYAPSAHILDNYYEAFERMFQSRMLWCYSPENSYEYGDGWNKEDFSVVDPAGKPRAQLAWNRPYAAALPGKPISTHFYSDYHYFDPEKGTQNPVREFEVRYASKETAAPAEIVVPPVQYPDGFYVWVSDGRCYYDPRTQTLYHFPSRDEPGVEHWVRLRPPLPYQENVGWSYFFRGSYVIRGS